MKKHTRIWAIVLMLTLIFSFEGLAVFAGTEDEQAAGAVGDNDIQSVSTESKNAEDGQTDPATYTVTWKNWDGTVLAEDTVEEGVVPEYSGSTPTKPEDGSYTYEFSGWDPEPAAADDNVTYTAQFTQKKKPAPKPAVTGLVAYAGATQTSNPDAGFVTLYWNANGAAVKYLVYADGRHVGTVTNANQRNLPASAGGARRVFFNVTGLNEYRTHSFQVVAYNADNATASASVRKQPVRPMNYVMKMKRKVTLKSHAGKSQKITLAKNTTIKAYGFSSGKFAFKRNGSIFYLARSRGKSKYAEYAKSFNYSRADAENYVNMANIGSSSRSTLIWVSTYCQHVYFFRGSKGNWRCVRDWECATGTVNGPSPSGMWGNKEIHKKIKRRHGLKFWSCYSSMNAFHGKQSRWKVGKPASSGCIRNANENAQFVYNNAPKRTKVIVN